MTVLLGHVLGTLLGARCCPGRTVGVQEEHGWCRRMGNVGGQGAGVPTHCRHAASDSPHSRQLPFLPRKNTSGKQHPAVRAGVVLGIHGEIQSAFGGPLPRHYPQLSNAIRRFIRETHITPTPTGDCQQPAALRGGMGMPESRRGELGPGDAGVVSGSVPREGRGKGAAAGSSWKRLGARGAGSAGGGRCAGGTPSRNAGSEQDGWEEERNQPGSAGGKWLPGWVLKRVPAPPAHSLPALAAPAHSSGHSAPAECSALGPAPTPQPRPHSRVPTARDTVCPWHIQCRSSLFSRRAQLSAGTEGKAAGGPLPWCPPKGLESAWKSPAGLQHPPAHSQLLHNAQGTGCHPKKGLFGTGLCHYLDQLLSPHLPVHLQAPDFGDARAQSPVFPCQ